MSSRYAIKFGMLSIGAVGAALLATSGPTMQIVLLWTAIAFGVVSLAYALNRPGFLMKRSDGSQPLVAWLVLWPYFLLARLSLWLYRVSTRGNHAFAEVVPGVWFSRRLTTSEMRDAGVKWAAVLDLAAEFPRVATRVVEYRSLPLLDGAVPSEEQLRAAAEWIDEQVKRGNVLVHCALGHGRTGSAVLAWLMLQGHVADVRTGIARLVSLRRSFGMSKTQAEAIARFAANCRAQRPGDDLTG